MAILEVYNNQHAIDIEDSVLEKFEQLGNLILADVLKYPANGGGVLGSLEVIEISIVDDATIAQVHMDFMDIPGATDVITFGHGEIVLSSETATLLASEYAHSAECEMFLYIIHGLLHLVGHEDALAEERKVMESIQFSLLEKYWKEAG